MDLGNVHGCSNLGNEGIQEHWKLQLNTYIKGPSLEVETDTALETSGIAL